MMQSEPTYSLSQIQSCIATGRYRITLMATNGAGEIGFRQRDICSCILSLRREDFYKTMEAERRPGFWQDVYRPRYRGRNIYLKVQLEGTTHDDIVVVVQFKQSTAIRDADDMP